MPQIEGKQLPRWQISLLLLMLLAFLAASFAFLQSGNGSQINALPPILYLAEDETGLLQLNLTNTPDWQPTKLTEETAVLLNYASTSSKIAYATTLPNGSSQIRLLSLNNGAASAPETLLTCDNAECSQLVWHPDGRRLLYERREPPNFAHPQLWWLDTETGETRLLFEKETAVGSSATFSPDGTWVSFAASPDEGLRLYNFGDGRSLVYPTDLGTPATWHPFNNQILIQNRRAIVVHGELDDNHDQHSHDFALANSLYLATIESESNELTTHLLSEDGEFNDGNAAWSPDGEWIAFGRRLARTNTGRQLWLMRADGSEAHGLTNDISIHYGPPSWSPDGRFLLYQQYNSNTPDEPPTVWLLEVASEEFIQVTNSGLLPTFLILVQ